MAILTPCPACPACAQTRARGTRPSTDGDGDEDGGDDDDDGDEDGGDDDGDGDEDGGDDDGEGYEDGGDAVVDDKETTGTSTCVNVVSGLGKR